MLLVNASYNKRYYIYEVLFKFFCLRKTLLEKQECESH